MPRRTYPKKRSTLAKLSSSGLSSGLPPRPRFSRRQRLALLKKTGGMCYLCNRIYTPDKNVSRAAPQLFFSDLEIDHVVARSRGGPDYAANLLPACRACNRSKAAHSLGDFLKKRT